MYLRISAIGDITVEDPHEQRDIALSQSLQAEILHAQRLSPNLTLVTDASKRWGTNLVATALLARAGIPRTVTGSAALLCCDGPRILDQITDDALDALDDVSGLPDTVGDIPSAAEGSHEEEHA